jgi:hypothetical protein
MKKTFLALASAAIFLTSSAYAARQTPHWVQIYVGMSDVMYINIASIVREYGDKDTPMQATAASAEFLTDQPDLDESGCFWHAGKKYCSDPMPFTSRITEIRFNCDNGRSLTTRLMMFRGHMGTGGVVDDFVNSPGSDTYSWKADRNTPMEQWEHLACNGFPERYRPAW